MDGFVISGQTTSEIHRDYNFNQKIIIPLGFYSWNKRIPLKNMYPALLELGQKGYGSVKSSLEYLSKVMT